MIYELHIDTYRKIRRTLDYMDNPRWAVWDYLEKEYGLIRAVAGTISHFRVTDEQLLTAFLLKWS